MKQTSYIVTYTEYQGGPVVYKCLYATSAQEAVNIVRYDLDEDCAYEVCECYKKVNNWN